MATLSISTPDTFAPEMLPHRNGAARKEVVYPESDGKPMADNTEQYLYLTTIKEGLEGVYRHRDDVFVAGDLLWYPVEGRPKIRVAPDVFVAIGRPKGKRGSYCQWLEEGIPPQVVFEVLSPGNRAAALKKKFRFYEEHGVEEYYVYDPKRGDLLGWLRAGEWLRPLPQMQGWTSPRLDVSLQLEGKALRLYDPAGKPFVYSDQLYGALADAEALADREKTRADLAECERSRERERAERMAARMRELGVDPDA